MAVTLAVVGAASQEQCDALEQRVAALEATDPVPGADGQDGADGEDGAPGKSAFDIAVANGFVGTQAQWLTSLRGPQGNPGTTYDDSELRGRIEVLEARPTGGGSSFAWARGLSTFTGATDDAKLSAALAWAKTQTMKGCTIVLDEARTYTFSQQQQAYTGLSISGPYRHQDQARSSKPIGNQVNIRTNGPWFTLPADTFGVTLASLSLDGNASASLIGGAGVLWTSVFHSLSAQNFGNLFGTTSQKLLNTACTFSGWWNINNVQSRAWVVGGSDTNFAFTECLLDSPPTLLAPTQYLAEFSSQSKGAIQNLYVTAEGHSAFRWTGSGASAQRMVVANSRIEGRHSDQPSPGALCRVEGSDVTFRDCWLSYAMSAPSTTGRNDAGVVHITGGSVLLDGIDYERADGVAESVPVVYASGSARVRVRNVNGVGFTGKPVVRQSVAGLIDADNSVTIITG